MAYPEIDPAKLCRVFFLLITIAGIGVSAVPTLRHLVSYGPRTVPISETTIPATEVKSKSISILDRLTNLQVPHTWFTHFYIVSVASSAFWASQLATNGVIFRLLASHYVSDGQKGMTMNEILITWALMTFQGSRRLYESFKLLRPSTARMPLASYILGIAFYLAVGVAVWAEGSSTLISSSSIYSQTTLFKLSRKTFAAIVLFFVASGLQHDSHVYLASLKKYTLPTHRLFRWVLCPHYTCECAIYLALAIVAAPQGEVLNKTISTVLLFTAANLAITANSTRVWYVEKFGEENIKGRSRLIPYLY